MTEEERRNGGEVNYILSPEVINTFNTSTSIRSAESPARYFYSAKTSTAEKAGTNHATTKPVSLMRYLCKLITPKGGVILDPFAGFGSTAAAARKDGFRSMNIELTPEFQVDIAKRLGLKSDFSAVDESIDTELQFDCNPPANDLVSFFDE